MLSLVRKLNEGSRSFWMAPSPFFPTIVRRILLPGFKAQFSNSE
jgi:hypothetical protein